MWLAIPLMPLGWVYRALVWLRLTCYRRGLLRTHKLGAPTISIGNLTVGGAGKTPLTEAIARAALRAGRRPVILCRGYKRSGRSQVCTAHLAESDAVDAAAMGDEPYLLASRNPRIPVFAGADRVMAARLAGIVGNPELFVLDDAYQHLRVARDCNVLLIDASRALGNGHMIPLGPLREPVSALRRADIVIISKANLGDAGEVRKILRERYRVTVPIYQADYVPARLVRLDGAEDSAPQDLRSREVSLVCGIAQPDGFAKVLRDLGGLVCGTLQFPDHVHYNAERLRRVADFARLQAQKSRLVVTTEKDAVKLRGRMANPELLWALEMDARPEAAAEAFFFEFMRGFS